MGRWRRSWVRIVGVAALAFGTLWVGTLIHESGHALAVLACGARVTEVNVMGLTLYPAPGFVYRPGFLGYVRFDRVLPAPQGQYVQMAGSLSTLAAALLAQTTMWIVPPRRMWLHLVGLAVCSMGLDVAWHTALALLGQRDASYAETYSALVALGTPARLAAGMLLGVPLALLVLAVIHWWQFVRRRQFDKRE